MYEMQIHPVLHSIHQVPVLLVSRQEYDKQHQHDHRCSSCSPAARSTTSTSTNAEMHILLAGCQEYDAAGRLWCFMWRVLSTESTHHILAYAN